MVYYQSSKTFLIDITATLPAGAQKTLQDPRYGKAESECTLLALFICGILFCIHLNHPTPITAFPGPEILAHRLKPNAGISRLCVEPGPAFGLFYFYERRFNQLFEEIDSQAAMFSCLHYELSDNTFTVNKTYVTIPALVDRVELIIYDDQLLPFCTLIQPIPDLITRAKNHQLPFDKYRGYHITEKRADVTVKQYLGIRTGVKVPSYSVVLIFNPNEIIRKQLIKEGHYNSHNDLSLNGKFNYIDSRRLVGLGMKDVCRRQAELILNIANQYRNLYPQMIKTAFGKKPTGSTVTKISQIEMDWDIPNHNARKLLEYITPEIKQHFGLIHTEEDQNSISKNIHITKGKSVGIYVKTLQILRMEARLTGKAIRRMNLRPEIGCEIDDLVELLTKSFNPFREQFLSIIRNSGLPLKPSAILDFMARIPHSIDSQKHRQFIELLIQNGRVKTTPQLRYQIAAAKRTGLLQSGARGYARIHPRYTASLNDIRQLYFQPKLHTTSNTVGKRGTSHKTTSLQGGLMKCTKNRSHKLKINRGI